MNVENLNILIAHLEGQPPEQINMSEVQVYDRGCGTCGCIIGHAEIAFSQRESEDYRLKSEVFAESYDLDIWSRLVTPDGWDEEERGGIRYPMARVIATLKRLRDTYLSTGQVVVDWGPAPGEEPKTPWVAPQVAEVIAPTLPAEITSLLRPSLAKTEA